MPSIITHEAWKFGKIAPVDSRRLKWYFEDTMSDQSLTASEGVPSFHLIAEAADRLSEEEQETLIELLNHRLAERRRAELIKDIQESEREFNSGSLRAKTPSEIMNEILS
jgi:hypothetical protein